MSYDDPFGMLCLWLRNIYKEYDRERHNTFDEWYKLITRYACRSLTFQTDVLQALAGIANAMAAVQNFSYGNGLWRDDLGVGLLWYIPQSDSKNDENLSESELKSVAPSWSWISQWGKLIGFWTWDYYTSKILCEVVDFQDPDEYYSDIRTLIIRYEDTLLAHLCPVDIRVKFDNPLRVVGKDVGYLAPDTGEVDSPPETVPMHDVFCLVCAKREPYGYPELTCLALQVTNRALGEYTRVGLVHTMPDDAFKTGKNIHVGWRSRWEANGVKSIVHLV
ncbi:hypothetical protein DL95DRAFT_410439 [Leptodontidium sp. 2 PMI_412]|nr:hypothetical protein DL95DRAFT_410439 [Leptodontidium sp. 2 PMI_412]